VPHERLEAFVAEVAGENRGVELERIVREGPAAKVLSAMGRSA
jgi:hypothetical protein